MIPNNELPVWTIKPNWRDAILERLIWLTQIDASSNGNEQAIAYRLSPRREFEVLFNPVGDVRSYFDLWLHRLGDTEFMVPLWHDAAPLTAALSAGATAIALDTTYREFEVGDMAALIGDTPHIFDTVEILEVTSGGITVAAGGITLPWPARTRIYPLRRSRLAQESQVAALTSRVGAATIVFELNQANDIDSGEWDGLTFEALPVLTMKPNYREQIDMSFVRNLLLIDNDSGLREIDDDAGRAFTTQLHSFMLHGRADHWAFRQMVYRLNGMQGAIWVPTFNDDAVLSRSRLGTDDFIDIAKIGYEYTGGVVSGRECVLIDNRLPARVTEVRVPASASEERLGLSAAISEAVGQGLRASFIDTCRLSSDTVEITHHSDTDGTAECNISFRSFLNERTADDPISYPIGTAAMTDTPCVPCHTLPMGEFPYTASATMAGSIYADSYIGDQTYGLSVPMWIYVGDECEARYILFEVSPGGPQVSAVGADIGCLSQTYYAPAALISCGSVGNPNVNFDFTCPVTIDGYALTGRFHFDGTTLGMEITNPDNHPISLITNPNPGFDFTLPLFGTPAYTYEDVPRQPAFAWVHEGHKIGGTDGWSIAIAKAHDFDLEVAAGGVTISAPYQRIGSINFAYDAYQHDYGVTAYYGLSSNNLTEFAPCWRTSSAGGGFGDPCV